MCIVPKRCNDMMNVGRLQGFDVRNHIELCMKAMLHSSTQGILHSMSPYRQALSHFLQLFLSLSSYTWSSRLPLPQGKIVAQGRLLLQDTFMVSDPEGSLLGRMKERRVFLFEQLLIFSEPLDKKKGFSLPGFLYKNSIKVTDKWVARMCTTILSVKAKWNWGCMSVKGLAAPSGGETIACEKSVFWASYNLYI